MSAAQPSRLPSRRTLLVLLGALSAFGPLAFDMYLPGLPRLADDLGASDTGAQLSLSLCMLGLGLGQMLVGPLSDQVGRRVPLLVGVAVFTLASLGCAFAPNLPLLLLGRLLVGLGGGAGAVIARSMVRDLFTGDDAARAYGITALVFGVAPVVAPLLGSALMALTGWRGIFVTIAACGAMLLIAALRLPETLPVEARHDGGLRTVFAAFPSVLRDRSFLAPALVLALGFLPLNCYLTMGSFALQEGYGLTAQQFGLVFAANSVGILLAGRLNLQLVPRVGPYRVLRACVLVTLAASVGVLAAALTHAPVVWLLVPLFLAIASVGPLMPNGTTLALERQGHAIGAAAACLGLVSTIFSTTVAPTISLVGATAVVMGSAMVGCAVVALAPLAAVPRDLRGRPGSHV